MYQRITTLETADKIEKESTHHYEIKSPLDTNILPWEVIPTASLYNTDYRNKKAFLSVYQVISNRIGSPKSICVLSGAILGVTCWDSISIERQYTAIQQSAGVFECSTMTYLSIQGPDAKNLLNQLTPRNVLSLMPGQAMFVLFTTESGTIDEDAMLLRVSEDEFLLSCGGCKPAQKTLSYLPQLANSFPDVTVREPDLISFNIKGPKKVAAMLQLLTDEDKSKVVNLRSFQFCQVNTLHGEPAFVLKTKVSMELWSGITTICKLWEFMLSRPDTYTPCAWDILQTFRMEYDAVLLSLYPLDINNQTSLWEIGCGWMVAGKSADYIGASALRRKRMLRVLKKIQAVDTSVPVGKIGDVLLNENGDFSGYITSSAFSIKANCAMAFSHLLVESDNNNHDSFFHANGAWKIHEM